MFPQEHISRFDRYRGTTHIARPYSRSVVAPRNWEGAKCSRRNVSPVPFLARFPPSSLPNSLPQTTQTDSQRILNPTWRKHQGLLACRKAGGSLSLTSLTFEACAECSCRNISRIFSSPYSATATLPERANAFCTTFTDAHSSSSLLLKSEAHYAAR